MPDREDARQPVGAAPVPARHGSGSAHVHAHQRVGSFVGSLGRQGFQFPLSKREREQARTLVFSDQLDGSSAQAASTADLDEVGDEGAILEEGVGAPSEARRVYNEERELLQHSLDAGGGSNSYGSTNIAPQHSSLSHRSRHSAASYPGFDEAVLDGVIETTVGIELKTIVTNALPLAVTFILQYSLIMASLFSVGHLGKVELGAVSLGGMTASITGTAFIQGMSTCLDTLCSQAYGAGRPDLVGLYFQKGVIVVMLGLLPILCLWYRADIFLPFIVNENEEDSERLVELATKYLRVMIFAMPGYCLFECGKRFMQAQGIFSASTMVLVICAPLNILITYTLVWNPTIGIGFIGAPISVAITDTLLALLLFSYVWFIDGRQCWNGFTWKVFENWGPLVQLAIPGLVMVESEFLAYEIMTLASSYLGTDELAVQTILSSIASLAYESPFAFGCAAATRVAGYIGAGLAPAAKLATGVAVGVALGVGLIDGTLIIVFRHSLSGIFSSDPSIITQAARIIPLCACMHFLDACGAVSAGLLRGQGRQAIGSYINLGGYYLFGVPLGLFLCFGPFQLGIMGIWIGFIAALLVVVSGSLLALRMSDWKKYIEKASERN